MQSKKSPLSSAFSDAPFDPRDLVAAFADFDSGYQQGRGESDSADSGKLGWGEASFLDAYVKLYNATSDTRWLDRVVDHVDRIFGSMADCFGDGRLTWVTDTYSVAWLETVPLHNRGAARLDLREARVWATRGGREVEEAELILDFLGGSRYRFLGTGGRPNSAECTFRQGKDLIGLEPFGVAVRGRPQPGDRFLIRTHPPGPLDYIVHQGQFLYPIALFLELARRQRSLKRRYGDRSRHYVDVIAGLARSHEGAWLDLGRGAGAYRFTSHPWERFPNRVLPHNQYLAMARAYLVLTTVSRRKIFRERGDAMLRSFRRCLRRAGTAYEWHYWDWVEKGQADHSAVEDTSHGNIDVGAAVEACRRDVVFRPADLRRFAHTFLDRVWNGSLTDPRLAHRVDGQPGDARTYKSWIDLCEWNPQVWDVLWALYERAGRPSRDAPTMLQGWMRLKEGRSGN